MSSLERRLRRLAFVIPALAIVATVFGFWPRGMVLEIHPWSDHAPYLSDRTSDAGGWALLAWTVVQLLFAAEIRARASRKRGWWWFGISIAATIGAGIGWFAEYFSLFDVWVPLWPGHVTGAFASAAVLLVVFALPAVLLMAPRDAAPTAAASPQARAISRRPRKRR